MFQLLDDKVTKELRLGLCNNATNVAEDEDYFLTLEGNLILSLTFGNVDFKGIFSFQTKSIYH